MVFGGVVGLGVGAGVGGAQGCRRPPTDELDARQRLVDECCRTGVPFGVAQQIDVTVLDLFVCTRDSWQVSIAYRGYRRSRLGLWQGNCDSPPSGIQGLR